MFEPFLVAPTSAKIVNIFILIFVFLSWVCTMVAFGSTLHTAKNAAGSTISFSWKEVSVDGNSYSLSGSCKSAGQGWIAMNVFAFLPLTVLFFGTAARLAGISVPLISDDLQHALTIEFIGNSLATFFFFLSICVWGGGCYSKSSFNEVELSDKKGVGFGYEIACFFFLIINVILLYFMRNSRPEWQIGTGSSSSSSSQQPHDRKDYDGPHSAPDTYSYTASDAGSS